MDSIRKEERSAKETLSIDGGRGEAVGEGQEKLWGKRKVLVRVRVRL